MSLKIGDKIKVAGKIEFEGEEFDHHLFIERAFIPSKNKKFDRKLTLKDETLNVSFLIVGASGGKLKTLEIKINGHIIMKKEDIALTKDGVGFEDNIPISKLKKAKK